MNNILFELPAIPEKKTVLSSKYDKDTGEIIEILQVVRWQQDLTQSDIYNGDNLANALETHSNRFCQE